MVYVYVLKRFCVSCASLCLWSGRQLAGADGRTHPHTYIYPRKFPTKTNPKQIRADNPDSLMNQELLLPGHLYTMFVKEKLEESLANALAQVRKECREVGAFV